MREIAFDTETTGLEPKQGHRIVEIGCVELIDRVRTGESYHVYLNPERDVPMRAVNIHGLTEEFLSDKPLFRRVAKEFVDFIGDSPLVIHNAAFDMKFINYELERASMSIINLDRSIDTLIMAREKFPGAKATLDALCERYGISLSKRDKHGALLDAELLADVYIGLTGGAQSSMFDVLNIEPEKKTANKVDKMPIKISSKKARKFTINDKEVEQHKKFIKENIKDALWNKYDQAN